MKVYFKLAKADMDIAALKIENDYWLISELNCVCRTPFVVSADATYVYFYGAIDVTVQGAGKYTGGVFTAAVEFQSLENDQVVTLSKWARTSVAQFVQGQLYLLPVSAVAPVPALIPDLNRNIIVSGAIPSTDGEILAQTKYRYMATQNDDVLNGANIADCITIEWDIPKQLAADEIRDAKKKMQELAFYQANGVLISSN